MNNVGPWMAQVSTTIDFLFICRAHLHGYGRTRQTKGEEQGKGLKISIEFVKMPLTHIPKFHCQLKGKQIKF
jgi:hypothetical protein